MKLHHSVFLLNESLMGMSHVLQEAPKRNPLTLNPKPQSLTPETLNPKTLNPKP